MSRILTLWIALAATGLQAATLTYAFDSDLSGVAADGLTATDFSFTHGTNSDASSSTNAQRTWYSGDVTRDDVYFISARSSDNKAGTLGMEPSLAMTAGLPSYASFVLTPPAGGQLAFLAATLDMDTSLYRDNTTSFSMGYQVWADSGTGWTVVGLSQTLDWDSGTGSNAIYETDEATVLTLGNSMTEGAVAEERDSLSFDLSSLGSLAVDQSITLALAISGTRDNHANFGSSIDNLIVTLADVVETNDAPVARDDAYSLMRGEELSVAAPGVLMNDTDPDGDAFSVLLLTNVTAGSLIFNTNGSFEYVPPVGYTGTVSFSYAPVDGVSTGNMAVATIHVLEPIAVERPNILIFFADDMGRGDSRVYNHSINLPPEQPTIEAFAASGMVFNDAHTQAALCAPSRYCILTGNYPWRGRLEGGSWHMNSGAQVMPGQQTLAHVLNTAGYHTSIFGKGHLGGYLNNSNNIPDTRQIVWGLADAQAYLAGDLSQQDKYYDPTLTDWSQPVSNGVSSALVGFDYSYILYGGIQDPLYAYFENDRLVGNPADLEVWDNPHFMTVNGDHWTYRPGYGLSGWYTCDVGPSLTQKTLDFIDAHVATNQANGTEAPFFIHYCAESVHTHHTPPVDFLGTPVAGQTDDPFGDMLYEMNVSFSNILHKLEVKGLLDDTLVIFTSDNGGLGISESDSGHNPNESLRGYKASIWEGGHCVPLFVKWGDKVPAGSYEHMVGIHDLYATIAQLVGKPQGDGQGLDAVSLLSVLLASNTAPVRDTLLMRGNSINRGDQDLDPVEFKGRALREGTYKMIWELDENLPLFLYDLSVDSQETVDLLDDPAQSERVARMTASMNDYVALVDDPDRHLDGRTEPSSMLRDLNENGMDDDWEVDYFGSTNAANGGALDDFDHDGINNLSEFAFGSDPSVSNAPSSVLPQFNIAADTFEYVYRRRQDAAARNLIYISQQSPTLLSNLWNSAEIAEVSSAFIDAEIETVTNHFPMAGTTNRFFRLKVEKGM